MTQNPKVRNLTISIGDFRSIMRRFAASVSVITSSQDGVLNGMTATAVCGVSDNPPSLLILVNRKNRTFPLIDGTKTFVVNLLSADQLALADHFASRPLDPFKDVAFSLAANGCPLIAGADAHLECDVIGQFDTGSHTIFVGKIISSEGSMKPPLVYHDGEYKVLQVSYRRV